MQRRELLFSALGFTAAAAGLRAKAATAQEKLLRVGVQKYGSLVLLKEPGTLEKRLASQGYTITWTEFPAGPQLLEALNVGAIDFGTTGEAPPIFPGRGCCPPLRRLQRDGARRRGDPGSEGLPDRRRG